MKMKNFLLKIFVVFGLENAARSPQNSRISADSKYKQISKMSESSSSSDSEASSSSEDVPNVTTHTERVIRRYQVKKSLILDRIFAIEQVKMKAQFSRYFAYDEMIFSGQRRIGKKNI